MVAFEASEVKVDIGKHEFKSCEETVSNPDQDNITFPGNKPQNKLCHCNNIKSAEDARNCTILPDVVHMLFLKAL